MSLGVWAYAEVIEDVVDEFVRKTYSPERHSSSSNCEGHGVMVFRSIAVLNVCFESSDNGVRFGLRTNSGPWVVPALCDNQLQKSCKRCKTTGRTGNSSTAMHGFIVVDAIH